MNQSTSSTSNKLNIPKVNNIKVNDPKVNDPKVNNTKVNNPKVNNVKGNDAKVNNVKVNDAKGNDAKLNDTKLNNKSLTTPAASTGYSGKNIAGMGLVVLVLIIVLGGSYWLYYYYYLKKSFVKVLDVDAMPDVKVASANFNIASNLIPNSTYSNEYSISCWVNILDYNYMYGKEKVILRRGDQGSANPEIILAPKTNDLIVRLKLQTPKGTAANSDNFIDIPIDIPINTQDIYNTPPTLNLDNYEETVSAGQFMYDESQIGGGSNPNTNISLKENFNVNISSYPAPVKFESNTHNNNESIDIDDSELGKNKVDYPTIKYISNHNTNFDDQYFSMISGNDVDNSKTVNCNDMSDYTRGGNHSINESFGDIEDAQKLVDDLFISFGNIMDILVPTTLPETEKYVLTSSVCNMIIEFLNQVNTIVKTGTSNFDTITASFKTTMNKVSKDPKMSNYIDKLVSNVTSLVKHNNITYDYSNLTSKINASPIIKSYKVQPINVNIFNPTSKLIDNLIILMKQIQVDSLQGSINENMPKGSTPTATAAAAAKCVIESSDPTVGSCSIKMIPLQKWVNVIVSVYNQVVDIYVDGLLTSSCVLKTFPAISTSDVSLTPDGGFSGYISRVKFLNSAMTVQKAKDIYYDGPIYSPTLFSQIPNWAYYTILVVILAAIGYSYYA